MKRTFLFMILTSLLTGLQAEEYTIQFNSGSGSNDSSSPITKIDQAVYTSTDNCVNRLLQANKVYRAKEGYGVKFSNSSEGGRLCIGLNATYNITSLTVYAAAFDGKDTITAFIVANDTILWTKGSAKVITPYSVKAPGNTDSLFFSATKNKNNRFYIEKVVFTAEDPYPGVAKITMQPKVDMGSAILIDGQPETDAVNVSIMARGTSNDSLTLNMRKGTIFSLSSSTLPHTGGTVNLSYTVTTASDKGYNIEDSMIIVARGTNLNYVRHAIPVTVFAMNYKAPDIPVDSSCMRIGKMPGNYYQPAQGLKDSLLKDALSEVVHCGPRYRYGSGKLHTWQGFFYTDRDTTTQEVLDMYSHNHRYFDLSDTCGSVAGFDIEHMLPKSWWGGNVNEAYCDLFHLVPADYSANRSKSNHAPGIPTDSTFNNGSFVTGDGSAYDLKRVFCPEDEYKGDFARAYFYIVTCYDTLHWIDKGDAAVAMTNDSYLEFQPWLQELLMSWHRMDPVSQKELDRAVEVNKIQGNRNPFIDYPELAEYIWGNKQGQEVNFYNLTQSYGDPYNDNPTGLSNLSDATEATKQVHQDQVIIVLDGDKYTILGNRVKP